MQPQFDHPSRSGSASLPLLAALLAAGVGTLAWAAVCFFTGYEVGYLAWGIGGLVGLAVVKTGGRGMAHASAAAVLAVAGIVGGKLLATHFLVEREFQQSCAEAFTPALHRELLSDAEDYAELTYAGEPADETLQEFLFDHSYTGAVSPADVDEDELEYFRTVTALELVDMQEKRPSHEDWVAQRTGEGRRFMAENFSMVQANLDSLGPIDALFVVLGVSTAFGLVRRASQPEVQVDQDAPASKVEDQDFRRAA